jgi:peptidoglycan/xylan/chitin deacetylase (PgdA/CDA1 family)
MANKNNKFTVVMYHYVRDLSSSNYPKINGLDINLFKEQLHYFKNNYVFITIKELIDAYESKSDIPKNSILLTFDDGYIDHYSNVFPILNDYKIQGCFYPPATTILNKQVLDVNKIHFILASVENKNLIVNDIFKQIDNYRESYNLKSSKYYFLNLAKANRFDSKEVIFIKRILQVALEEDLRKKIVSHLFEKYVTSDEKSFSEELYMSTENIKTMIDCGMHFGSHGHKHYWLSSLSKEEQEFEISKSLNFLSDMGENMSYWTMCYPYGDYNNDTLDLLKKYDCKAAFTTRVKVANLNDDNKFEIPRLDTNDFLKKT